MAVILKIDRSVSHVCDMQYPASCLDSHGHIVFGSRLAQTFVMYAWVLKLELLCCINSKSNSSWLTPLLVTDHLYFVTKLFVLLFSVYCLTYPFNTMESCGIWNSKMEKFASETQWRKG